MNLFQTGVFILHNGETATWKIDCDALTDEDLECLAEMAAEQVEFAEVIPIPNGGVRFANALREYAQPESRHPALIVDDVLTTGKSMEEERRQYPGANGVVIFARGPFPNWIWPMFTFEPPWRRHIPGDLAVAAQPFANFADSKHLPDDFNITMGSSMARRQLTMGDCRRINAVLHAYKTRKW